ncbi:MAG: hypothetical protein ABI791_07185 [Acidobacteriota bacterium]
MYTNKRLRYSVLLSLIFAISTGSGFAQKKASVVSSARPVLWESVTGERDLYYGPGGEDVKPDLRKVTFIKEDKNGHNKKFEIKDAKGRTWIAKLGSEAQPETAAVRILYGIGYKTEINYLVPKITIPGQGTFENVRLEARRENVKRLDEWKWKENPFVGTNQLQGLKIMMVFFTNWDLLDLQNKVLQVREGGGIEHQYVISDLGATFGKLGNNNLPLFFRLGRKTNDAGTWNEAGFISDIRDDGTIDFDFKGKGRGLMNDITIAQGRWLADQLKQLTDRQINDAFRAANYSPDEVELMVVGFKGRVDELDKATRQVTAVKINSN